MLAPVLSYYFSCAFELGVFPNYFKTAKVIPIFKSGIKNVVSNYRLLSLPKVLEKLIKGRPVKFFDRPNIWYEYQYGFREKHSISHALLDVSSLCYDSIQNKLHTAMLFMDLRKAFDTVSHKILLHKLCHYEIRGPALSLINSYLSSRKQYVSINNVNSSSKMINIGVPQGSILGPLLFLIYVHDLFNATLTKPRLFADDTCFVISNSSPLNLELQCNLELQNLCNWCNANKLQINPEKSCILHIPSKLNSSPIDLNLYCFDSDRPLAQLLSARYRAGGLGFDSRTGPIGTVSPTTRHRCYVCSELCCPGAKPRRWAPQLVTRFGVIRRV